MPLTDTACRNAKPAEKPRKLADGGGLYLLVTPTGAKYWRLKYRFGGKERLLALGVYPEVTLAQARDGRAGARDQLRNGQDPATVRRLIRLGVRDASANTFEVVAREWFKHRQGTWVASHGDRILRRFERDIFPWIGARPIADITVPEILAVLRKIQARGAIETAHRARWDCSQVFKYAAETGRAERDPTASFSRDALQAPAYRSHAAVTDPAEVGRLVREIDAYKGGAVVRAALRLQALLWVRPGELRNARWEEFDLAGAVWEIPGARMKRPKAEKIISSGHLVPLSRQAVAILRELHALTGPEGYVFPSPRTKTRPMSENAVLAALRGMGYGKDQATGHGFRATARTLAVERLRIPAEYVELQLAHAVKDANGRAYNRVQWIEERTAMMQQWADYLDRLAAGATVVPITVAA
ncbi:MAG: integrase arm-type DNA-binding domain-containing protein [Burkholderiaceae bacterium]|jgi:integrase|nr:integrase arm-type DNA-binding domain-containing protein [Burkholderiaceae bacterium]